MKKKQQLAVLPLKENISVDKIKKLRVYTKDGVETGRVEDITIHPTYLMMESIIVKKDDMEGYQEIAKEYICKIEKEGIFLNIIPVDEYIGMPVYDREDIFVGTVVNVKRIGLTNQLQNIVVAKQINDKDLVNISPCDFEMIGRKIKLYDSFIFF